MHAPQSPPSPPHRSYVLTSVATTAAVLQWMAFRVAFARRDWCAGCCQRTWVRRPALRPLPAAPQQGAHPRPCTPAPLRSGVKYPKMYADGDDELGNKFNCTQVGGARALQLAASGWGGGAAAPRCRWRPTGLAGWSTWRVQLAAAGGRETGSSSGGRRRRRRPGSQPCEASPESQRQRAEPLNPPACPPAPTQRAHQNSLETAPTLLAMQCLLGLQHPITAAALGMVRPSPGSAPPQPAAAAATSHAAPDPALPSARGAAEPAAPPRMHPPHPTQVWNLGRVVYALGYSTGDPSKRAPGGIVSSLVYLGLIVATGYTGIKVAML
jgi:hypothetical protein